MMWNWKKKPDQDFEPEPHFGRARSPNVLRQDPPRTASSPSPKTEQTSSRPGAPKPEPPKAGPGPSKQSKGEPTASPTLHVEKRRERMEPTAIIGQSILIKGELSGNEDLTIEGKVEGKIELKDHNLIIGANGNIKAQIMAKSITVHGEVLGNVTATEKVEIKEKGKLRGDIISPRVIVNDGAFFKGGVDMEGENKTKLIDKRIETFPAEKALVK